MNIESVRRYAEQATRKYDNARGEAKVLQWAVRHIEELEMSLARAEDTIAYLKKVCDENRWTYDKEK